MEMRLQKFLAEAGVASRRKSEELIKQGLITVNGKNVTELGVKINTLKDIVTCNKEEIKLINNNIYIMLHKPKGYVTTVKDQFERKTVLDIIKNDINTRVYPIGRLDFDTSGLLILTNDGNLTYKLTHPKHEIEKVYMATVIGIPTQKSLEKFRNGLLIDNFKTSKAKIEIINKKDKNCDLKITIKEGRNRQVRKMCEAIGHKVIYLKRIAIGKLFLSELKKGEYRHLTKNEIYYLKNL